MRNGNKSEARAKQDAQEVIEERTVQVQPVQTILTGCRWEVQPTPDGGKQIVVFHSTGSQAWVIPLTSEGVRELAGELAGIEIAGSVPGAA